MILNPPHIYQLLKTYRLITFLRPSSTNLAQHLAVIFRKTIGHPEYPAFQKTYQLYLQQIPLEIASQAWGINQATLANHLNPISQKP